MKAQKDAGLMASGAREKGTDRGTTRVPEKPASITLAEVGIDKGLADRARKYAAVPDVVWNTKARDATPQWIVIETP